MKTKVFVQEDTPQKKLLILSMKGFISGPRGKSGAAVVSCGVVEFAAESQLSAQHGWLCARHSDRIGKRSFG